MTTTTATTTTAALVDDYESRHACAKCGTVWVGSGDGFAVLVGMGDGLAHVIHHDCPNPDGRDWWTEPAPLRPAGRTRARRLPKWNRPPVVDRDQVIAAAQHIREAALRNRINFTAVVWRIPMDKAAVPPQLRPHAVAYAIREQWIEVMDLVAGDDPAAQLEQYDQRETRWRSLIYQPKRPLKGAHSKAGRPRP